MDNISLLKGRVPSPENPQFTGNFLGKVVALVAISMVRPSIIKFR